MVSNEYILKAKIIKNKFFFEDILPGIYKLEIFSENYCWINNFMTIKVQT
jgi:hypothetical protein